MTPPTTSNSKLSSLSDSAVFRTSMLPTTPRRWTPSPKLLVRFELVIVTDAALSTSTACLVAFEMVMSSSVNDPVELKVSAALGVVAADPTSSIDSESTYSEPVAT